MFSFLEIARVQLLENIRRQVHLVTLFMAAAMLILPAYVNAFSMGLKAFGLVTKDFGLTAISYYGIAMALLLGSSVVPRDIERKTIYPILSRPLGRVTYLGGQFLGTAVLVSGSVFLLTMCMGLGIASLSREWDSGLFAAAWGYSLESALVVAICMCFSVFASPPLAGVLGFFVYTIGGMPNAFIQFFLREDRGALWVADGVEALQRFVPNFAIFRLKYPVVHGIPIHPEYHLAESLYAFLWILMFLLIAGIRFETKDL
ncbi:MAG: ABC transporter permease [Candidatus Eremiobacteraeota bacterium]|nr:ABC transporter permease [Candidatus Eremiobacteraeota bacterium]